MFLDELELFNKITIQCHNDPDADTIASGYALYLYFKQKNINVRLIYSGKNIIKKSNISTMVNMLDIPIEYVDPSQKEKIDGLLITVDCQYGQANVERFEAKHICSIDHHNDTDLIAEYILIKPQLGSCSTLIWSLLNQAGYDVNSDKNLATALYYGLFTDTNNFSELNNPEDKDMREQLIFDEPVIYILKNSNISLAELEIASVAMLRYIFNEEYGFAIVHSQPCDPNILGLISDFLLQVDKIRVCVVFNEQAEGVKISVRSCIKEVNAAELAGFLCENLGGGGGHFEKAGGYINITQYEKNHPGINLDAFFNLRMIEYFESFEIIEAAKYEADINTMTKYQKKDCPVGFVKMTDVLPVGTPISIRTMEGDLDTVIEEDLYIIIGIKGEVYPNKAEKFNRSYKVLDEEYVYDKYVILPDYVPTVKNKLTGENKVLTDFAHVCVSTGKTQIYSKTLTKNVKVFTSWDPDKYMLGKVGDELVVRTDDLHDVYICEKVVFSKTYEKISE